jgi:hypothetical protein
MVRVLPILVVSATVVAGCALDPASPVVITKTVTKFVPVKERGRTCRIETRPMTSAEFCATKLLQCSEIKTCAEAYYRLTVCKQVLLDGGTARGTYDKPNAHGASWGGELSPQKEDGGPDVV